MGERAAVERKTGHPNTVASLRTDLAALGVQPGMVLLVHSSLSSLGWVSGGPVAVILALEELLGPVGTLVMPTHSSDLSDPADAKLPVPDLWWEVIRDTMPAFDPDLTPTRAWASFLKPFASSRASCAASTPRIRLRLGVNRPHG